MSSGSVSSRPDRSSSTSAGKVTNDAPPLRDATVLLTGATAGIGRASAVRLAPRVGTLLVHGPQDAAVVQPLISELRELAARERVEYFEADYGDLGAVREMAAAVESASERLDVLINNAGRPGPPRRQVTADGNEVTLQTNFLAATVLTDSLLGFLEAGEGGRIVNVASATHYSASLELGDLNLALHDYSGVRAYARSKLAMVAWTVWLAERLASRRVDALSLHPGVIGTELLHAMFGAGGAAPERAAANVVYAVEAGGDVNGAYFDETRRASPNPEALDPEVQSRLMAEAARLI
jgi:NAD(P)-dependent dehydrogenase (short-subunit alcohol dehydrogenase family)